MTKQLVAACSVSLILAAAASAQTPAGGEFRVNTYTTGRQSYARAATAPNGDFVIVWSSDDGSNDGLFGQRFAATGVPRGSEFRINSYTTAFQTHASLAVGSRGDFVVVWESIQDGSGSSIEGRRFDAAGNPIGAEFLVNTFTTSHQSWPHVRLASDGRFVVSWMSKDSDGSAYGVAARRFDASGHPIGSDFVVNSYTTGNQTGGNLAVDGNGNFVVVWLDCCAGGGGIFGQRYDALGNPLGSEFKVNSHLGNPNFPSVSMAPSGGFVVAWQDDDDGSWFGVFARRFDASGNPVGNDFAVNTYTTGPQLGSLDQVAHDARGNFVVTWWDPGGPGQYPGVFAQRYSASGVPRGLVQVNTYTSGLAQLASVASDAVGNFVVTWLSEGQDGSDFGVFAQRFGGLGPAALTVDSSGNQVLEPGETVEVRPAWRNINGAAQTFSATLTAITGPAGATYTINDPTGDYGTVANDATGPCTDCYTVTVSNPNPRPALHWDASAVESILPDAQGQQMEWLLHVGVSFADVATASPFYPFIEALLHKGVTSGCGGNNYCPSGLTTRDQMSVFVLLAKEGAGYTPPACGTPVFTDVPASNTFCKYIEELARRGVVSGCGGGSYCPSGAVTREQMSVFALRTLDPTLNPPACGTPLFGDVPATNPFCKWIEELARRGVVSGCGGGNYCPTQPATREQMGVFISATFGLTLYGP
jgi:hypothetical protein